MNKGNEATLKESQVGLQIRITAVKAIEATATI
jgi:hypothetical protein